jgi:hypothetical protein
VDVSDVQGRPPGDVIFRSRYNSLNRFEVILQTLLCSKITANPSRVLLYGKAGHDNAATGSITKHGNLGHVVCSSSTLIRHILPACIATKKIALRLMTV